MYFTPTLPYLFLYYWESQRPKPRPYITGIATWIAHLQQDYQRTNEDVQKVYNRPYVYLSGREMDGFIDGSTWQLSRIYQHLWINGAAADGFISALDLTI